MRELSRPGPVVCAWLARSRRSGPGHTASSASLKTWKTLPRPRVPSRSAAGGGSSSSRGGWDGTWKNNSPGGMPGTSVWLPDPVAAPGVAAPLGRLRRFEADDYGPAPSLSAPTQSAASQATAAARIPRFSPTPAQPAAPAQPVVPAQPAAPSFSPAVGAGTPVPASQAPQAPPTAQAPQ